MVSGTSNELFLECWPSKTFSTAPWQGVGRTPDDSKSKHGLKTPPKIPNLIKHPKNAIYQK